MELQNKLKEIIVAITTDHDTDTLDGVMDGYVGRFVDAVVQNLQPLQTYKLHEGSDELLIMRDDVLRLLTEAKSPSHGSENKVTGEQS